MYRCSPLSALAGCASLLAAFGLSVASPAHAAACDTTYAGAPGGAWTVPGNWSGAALPTSGQAVCIPAGAGTVEVPAGATADAKSLSAQSGLRIASGATLALADATGRSSRTSRPCPGPSRPGGSAPSAP